MRRTSLAGKRSRMWARRLAVAGALAGVTAVAAPLPDTQAAGPVRREPVGHADAQVAEAGPVAAGLSLAAAFGTAAGDLAGRAARAEAATVQPGLLGAVVPEELAGSLPPPTRADSGGEQAAERSVAAAPGLRPAALAGARERASASAERAVGVAELATLAVEGALSASGGVGEAEVAAGRSRAESRIAELRLGAPGAGGVVLRGLRWTAHHAEGGSGEAAFEIASAEVGGRAVTPDRPGDVSSVVAAAREVLAAQGIKLSIPVAAGDAAGAAVGPLLVEVRDAPALRSAGAAVYAPLAPAVSDASERLQEASGPAGPQVGSALLVGNVVLSTLLGNGGVTFGFGGASAGATTREVPDLDFFSGLRPPPLRDTPYPSSEPPVPSRLATPSAAATVAGGSGLAGFDADRVAIPAAQGAGGLGDAGSTMTGPAGADGEGAAGPGGVASVGSAARRHAGPVTAALAAGLAVASFTVRRSR
ncbi:MAG: hypothetical protein AB1679_36595, partial [Actinomycetota bacterium]